jgi:hypothetical protein
LFSNAVQENKTNFLCVLKKIAKNKYFFLNVIMTFTCFLNFSSQKIYDFHFGYFFGDENLGWSVFNGGIKLGLCRIILSLIFCF